VRNAEGSYFGFFAALKREYRLFDFSRLFIFSGAQEGYRRFGLMNDSAKSTKSGSING
jgi:hypothetical protein